MFLATTCFSVNLISSTISCKDLSDSESSFCNLAFSLLSSSIHTKNPLRTFIKSNNIIFAKMQHKTQIIVALLSIFLTSSLAVVFSVSATDEECFYENLQQGTPAVVMFQVIEGGFLDIDVSVPNFLNYI
jgi:hypothetical protein